MKWVVSKEKKEIIANAQVSESKSSKLKNKISNKFVRLAAIENWYLLLDFERFIS